MWHIVVNVYDFLKSFLLQRHVLAFERFISSPLILLTREQL